MTPVLHRFRAIHRGRFTARIAKSFLLVAVGMLSVGATQEPRPARADQGSQSKPFPQDCNPTRIKDIESFHLVDTDLYRGGQPAYRQDVYMELAELGIRILGWRAHQDNQAVPGPKEACKELMFQILPCSIPEANCAYV
jgi:hypothetical protein